jgi:hypothetical protein
MSEPAAETAELPSLRLAAQTIDAARAADNAAMLVGHDAGDDRNTVAPGDPAVLIVEDDGPYARVLLDLARV